MKKQYCPFCPSLWSHTVPLLSCRQVHPVHPLKSGRVLLREYTGWGEICRPVNKMIATTLGWITFYFRLLWSSHCLGRLLMWPPSLHHLALPHLSCLSPFPAAPSVASFGDRFWFQSTLWGLLSLSHIPRQAPFSLRQSLD